MMFSSVATPVNPAPSTTIVRSDYATSLERVATQGNTARSLSLPACFQPMSAHATAFVTASSTMHAHENANRFPGDVVPGTPIDSKRAKRARPRVHLTEPRARFRRTPDPATIN